MKKSRLAAMAVFLFLTAQPPAAMAAGASFEPNWPANWLEALKIDWKPVEDPKMRETCNGYLAKFAKAYRPRALDQWLTWVNFVDRFSFDGVRFGGTYDPVNRRIWSVCTRSLPEEYHVGNLHHEFSSILFYNNQKLFDRGRWLALTKGAEKAYVKSDEDRGFEEAEGALKSDQLDPRLYEQGFLTPYNTVSIEEDFNRYAEYVFARPEMLARIGAEHQRVHGKIAYVKAFYRQLGLIR